MPHRIHCPTFADTFCFYFSAGHGRRILSFENRATTTVIALEAVSFLFCSETLLSCCWQPPVLRPLKWINERPTLCRRNVAPKSTAKMCALKNIYSTFFEWIISHFAAHASCSFSVCILRCFLDVNEGRAGGCPLSHLFVATCQRQCHYHCRLYGCALGFSLPPLAQQTHDDNVEPHGK